MANPVTVTLEAPKGGVITCIANASYYQRVEIQFPNEAPVVFQGTGEEVPMNCQWGHACPIHSINGEDYDVTLTFLYSTSGQGGEYQLASVKDPIITKEGNFISITIMSEDSTDNDNNDSYLSILYTSVS